MKIEQLGSLRARRYAVVTAASIVIAACGLLWVAHAETGSDSTDAVARAIVAACANSGSDHSACYESEVPDLYPKLSVPQLFDIVREIRQLDPSYQYCHVLGHKIGNRVVAEDPSTWVDDIPLNPSDGLCSNGFIHGVFEGRFGADVLSSTTIQEFMPQFQEACAPHDSWDPSRLDRAICYHGMGHLADFITNANLPEALDLCTQIAPTDYQRVCFEGVFMQIYQPLEPDDYALIAQMPVKPTAGTVRQFCSNYAANPEWEGSCLEESWPMFKAGIFNGTGVKAFCSGQPNATETNVCYMSVSSIVGRTSLGDISRAVSACDNFPSARQEMCFSYSAEAVLEENLVDARPAVQLCERAPNAATENGCLSDLANHADFMFGDKGERDAFCALLPTSLQDECEGAPQSNGTIQYSDVISQPAAH